MVRSLTQWTKTLSFPARISPNKSSKESVNIHQVSPIITPTLSNNSLSKNNDINNMMNNHASLTEVNQIYSDPESEKAIMSSIVYCIHHKEGCKWSDELRKLKGHLNTCKHDAIPCTSKCGAQIPRVLMEDHLKYTCPQRRTRCEFCNKEFTGHALENHAGHCGYEPLYCENKCGVKIHRRHLSQHKIGDCSKRLVPCRYCTKEFVADTLAAHHVKCGRVPVQCPNSCNGDCGPTSLCSCGQNALPCNIACKVCAGTNCTNVDMITAKDMIAAEKEVLQDKSVQDFLEEENLIIDDGCDVSVLAREELESHLKEECTVSVHSCNFKDAGCRFKGPRYVIEKHLEENCQQHLTLMCSMVSKQQHQITSLKTALSRLSLNYSGTLIWKISEFSTKMVEAKTKEGMELVSPPFYTSQYGYKLQASLFPNGNGAGEDSHISVYIKILPGEYDALLRWPFAHSVSFTLFDQSTCPEKACNIVESFIPDPTWKNFQRPSREPDSLGFGFPKFVSHEMLKKRHFMKDDTLFLRIKVDPSKIVAV